METPEQLMKYFTMALSDHAEKKGHGFTMNLARYLGCDPSLMSKYVRGVRRVPVKLQPKIALACGYEYEDFLRQGKRLLTINTPGVGAENYLETE